MKTCGLQRKDCTHSHSVRGSTTGAVFEPASRQFRHGGLLTSWEATDITGKRVATPGSPPEEEDSGKVVGNTGAPFLDLCLAACRRYGSSFGHRLPMPVRQPCAVMGRAAARFYR